jgi:hypothetical protein
MIFMMEEKSLKGFLLVMVLVIAGFSPLALAQGTTSITLNQGICGGLTAIGAVQQGPIGALGGLMCGLTIGQFGGNAILSGIGMGLTSYYIVKEKIKSDLKSEEKQSEEKTVNPVQVTNVFAEVAGFYPGPGNNLGIAWQAAGEEAIESISGEPQKIWKRKAVLTNPNNKEGTFDGTLTIGAVRNEYATEYGTLSYGKRPAVALKDSKNFSEEFHMLIKSLAPEKVEERLAPRAVDCLSKYWKGQTGPSALPKVLLAWNWNDIASYQSNTKKWICDDGHLGADLNSDAIYCDAVQFNIELMDRLNKIDTELTGQSVNCNANEELNDCLNRVNPSNKTTLLALLNFKTYLVKDGFSADLKNDFDAYYRLGGLLTSTHYYATANTGLYKYLTDSNRFRVVPAFNQELQGDYLLDSPGIYNAAIKVTFDSAGIGLFSSNNPRTKVKAVLDRINVAKPDNVFYYMPFDGPVGLEGGSIERNGYGVNYSGENIKVNNTVQTLSVGHGVSLKTIDITKQDSFKAVNNDKRGRLMEVSQDSIVWSPSNASPVMIEVDKNARGGDAFAFYALSIAGQAPETGTWLLPWTGVGLNCKDFTGQFVTDAFDETPDIHAINRQCGRTDPLEEGVAYGLTWCNLPESSQSGSVFLRSIIYTPQGKTGMLSMGGASDSAKFLDRQIIGTTYTSYPINGVALTGGATGLAYNDAGANTTYLDSIDRMFSLVKDGYGCISSTSGAKAVFFWNPKTINNLYSNAENAIITGTTYTCIK